MHAEANTDLLTMMDAPRSTSDHDTLAVQGVLRCYTIDCVIWEPDHVWSWDLMYATVEKSREGEDFVY